MFTTKLAQKICDTSNTTEYYHCHFKKKIKKLLKQSKLITQQLKAIENSNKVGIKSFIMKHPVIIKKLCIIHTTL